MNARTDIMLEAGQRQFLCPHATADGSLGFQYHDFATRLCQCDCRRQPVGTGADDHRIVFGQQLTSFHWPPEQLTEGCCYGIDECIYLRIMAHIAKLRPL